MIDAGSSGSRIHVFTYHDATPLPEFELPSKTLKLKPGARTLDFLSHKLRADQKDLKKSHGGF
jgi:Golgi nucleoside diphosphatase